MTRRHTRTRPGQPPATRIRARDLVVDRLLYPERDFWRPRTRADCASVPRPCPYVGCRYNLFLEVAAHARRVGLRFNYHNRDVWELEHSSCALDFAERGGMTNKQVGEVLHCHTSVVSRVSTGAIRKVKRLAVLQ